ncbi:MAG: PilN domain-containing protein [Thermodesulfovibrionales bacterium]
MSKTAGVNIRADMISGFMAEQRFRSLRPLKYEDLELPGEAAQRNAFISGTFQRWRKDYGPDDAVIGLPLQHFSHQFLDMPAMNRQDLRNALAFELEKYLPLPVEEYIFDFISMPAEPGRSKVLVLSLKKGIVNDLGQAAQGAGLPLRSVRCSFLTALGGLLAVSGEKRLSGIVLHMTGGACEVAVLKNSLPLYLKSCAKGTDLEEEVRRLLVRYPGRVYVIGNSESALIEKFSAARFHLQIPQLLAAAAFRTGPLDLEFLASGPQEKKMAYYPQMVAGLVAASLLLYLLTGLTVYVRDNAALRGIEARRASLRAAASGVLEAKKKMELLKSDRNTVLDFLGRSNTATKVLGDVSRIIPADAWLISLSADDRGKIELEGFTGKTSSVVMALEKSGLFREISYTAPIIAKDDEERFALKMEVRESDK